MADRGTPDRLRGFYRPLMARKSKTRRRARRLRRAAQRDNEPTAPTSSGSELRDPRTRWLNLSARGGHTISFIPTGVTVPIDFDAPDAENTLVSALAGRMCPEAGES